MSKDLVFGQGVRLFIHSVDVTFSHVDGQVGLGLAVEVEKQPILSFRL